MTFSLSSFAQSPSDALLMEARQACVVVDYNYASFNKYWQGDLKRENQTIQTVKRHTLMPMAAIGVFDDLNLFVGLPFIKTYSTVPNGGRFNGARGFQDLTVALKYKWLEKDIRGGRLKGLATLGFSTPISNYLSDYMPYSLGLGAPELSYRAILQYRLKKDWYIRGAGTYLWRGYTKAEREYYYNNGSYYTPWMDVPNAITTELAIGKWFLEDALQVEISYFGSKSLSGDDIRVYNAPQPTNNIDSDRVGIFAHYHFPKINGLGILAYHNRVVRGRNSAQLKSTGFGVSYFFNYLKNKTDEK